MGRVFDDLKQGFEEAIAHAKGEKTQVRVHHFPTPETVDVKAARKKLHMTQKDFASAFGISLDTIRNWETGRRDPEGPARVLITLIERNPQAVLDVLHG